VTAGDVPHRERNDNWRLMHMDNPWNLFAVHSWSVGYSSPYL